MHAEGDSFLLTAEFGNDSYANACIVASLIITAGHVAPTHSNDYDVPLTITCPQTQEIGWFSFQQIAGQDLAISHHLAAVRGLEVAFPLSVGTKVTLKGYHGSDRHSFEIEAEVVVQCVDTKRVIIERLRGPVFQLGMSGTPAFTVDGKVGGILVRGVPGTDGEQVYLELLGPVFARNKR